MNALQPRPLAVIFDLDGTLADTFPLIVEAWNAAMLGPLGRSFRPDEVVARFGIPDSAMVRRELPEEQWAVAEEHYYARYEASHDRVQPFAGITTMLRALQHGGLPLGLMTGKGTRATAITLRLLRWDGLFGSVVTGDDVAEQKPHPEGVLRAALELGVDPTRCIYVGDSPGDIEAGKAAGMITVAAGWHDYYHEQVQAVGPTVWATEPADIVRLCGLT